METILSKFFNKHHLAIANKTVVVAVSTGVDSMALLFGMISLRKKQPFKIIVAHFNHHKRPQSEDEQSFIEKFSQENQLTCFVGHLKYQENGNFQALARQKRYEFFKQVCESTQASFLVLAHHADDNVETMMMRLLRGSNLSGYSGMEPLLPFYNIWLVRPFLEVSKQTLIDYALKTKLTFFEDSSNQEDYYTRNRIRHHLMPLLKEEQPLYVEKFQAFSETLKAASVVVKERINQFINDNGTINADQITFSKSAFLMLSAFLQQEVLFFLFKDLELSKAQIETIIKGLTSSKPNWQMTVKKKKLILREYDDIKISNPLLPLAVSMMISQTGTYSINDIITVNVMECDEKTLISQEKIWYNSHMLPVLIRTRRPGDKIKLEGGTKKVSDLLTDLKVTKKMRDAILILEKDEEILAVIGVRKSIKLKDMKNCDIIIEVKNHG